MRQTAQPARCRGTHLSHYVFAEAAEQREYERLRLIEKSFDPATERRLLQTGIEAGWQCLEVGVGAGSIACFIAAKVGAQGRVVAADIAPRFVGELPNNAELVEVDIRDAVLGAERFDLIHARYVLIHIADFEKALDNMLRHLKPGGFIVLEEPDFSAARPAWGSDEDIDHFDRVNRAIATMFSRLHMDHAIGLRLPALLHQRGLAPEVECETHLQAGGGPVAEIMARSTEQLRDQYLDTGKVSEEDLRAYVRFAEDPQTWAAYYATVAAIAKKPLTQ
ncbi:MAG: ubiquinone/menaquinone biosynthesis C-methylase UbiE [Candidatus Latescibacterota bacterium]